MPKKDREDRGTRPKATQDSADKLNKLRKWFKSAVERESDWKDEAYTCFEFTWGKQWEQKDVERLNKEQRPSLTINKILPLINLLDGHQKLNVTEPDFRPRGDDDQKLRDVRKGVTKYLLDQNDYLKKKSRIFRQGIIGGRGYLYPHVKFNYDTMEPEIKIDCKSMFDIYVDPESRDPMLDDANYICDAHWVDKDDVNDLFPEWKEDINSMVKRWDEHEESLSRATSENTLYDPVIDYDKTTKKVRLVNIWYRDKVRETRYLFEGSLVKKKDLPFQDEEMIELLETRKIPRDTVRVASFVGDILLEDKKSPYEHGYLPVVPFNAYYEGEGDMPFGVVKNLLDPQREINKRRSQFLHIVNTMANRGWFYKSGSLSAESKRKLDTMGSTPGVTIEYNGDKPEPWATDQIPATMFELDKQYSDDIRFISGINEAMLAVDMPASTSGRAIELRQKQAVTQIANLFDNLKAMEKRLVRMLWGEPGKKGLIPQFMTEEKTFRIISETGDEKVVNVNQRVQERPNIPGMPFHNPFAQVVERTLNDLSVGEFDIVITDSPATPTQRASEYYALLELRKAGVEIPPHIIVDSYDFAHKEELKQWYMQQMQMAQQAQGPPQQGQVTPGQPGAPGPQNPGGRGNVGNAGR